MKGKKDGATMQETIIETLCGAKIFLTHDEVIGASLGTTEGILSLSDACCVCPAQRACSALNELRMVLMSDMSTDSKLYTILETLAPSRLASLERIETKATLRAK